MILYLIGQLTTDGGTGYAIEYTGERHSRARHGRADDGLQHVDRSRRPRGMIAPDEMTFDYLRGREFAPADFDAAVARWRQLPTDAGAKYDRVADLRRRGRRAASHLGHESRAGGHGRRQDAQSRRHGGRKRSQERRQRVGLHGPQAGHADCESVTLDRVFIGSCTNSRIAILRAAAAVVKGYHVAGSVHAMVVPGSGR